MTQENKELLLKDLCARLPYGVKVTNGIYTITLTPCSDTSIIIKNEHILPYLRPMSSMTEEEKKIMRSCGFELIHYDTGSYGFANIENCIDEISFKFMEEFLNAHHFDYRGLIELGFAIEAPEGMYNID